MATSFLNMLGFSTDPLQDFETIFKLAKAKLKEEDYRAAWILFNMAMDLAPNPNPTDEDEITKFFKNIEFPDEIKEQRTDICIDGYPLENIFQIFNFSQIERDAAEEKALLEKNENDIKLIRMTDAMYARSRCPRKELVSQNGRGLRPQTPPETASDLFDLARTVSAGAGDNSDRQAAYYLAKLAYLSVDDNHRLVNAELRGNLKKQILSFIIVESGLSATEFFDDNGSFVEQENILRIKLKTPQRIYAETVYSSVAKMEQSHALDAAIVEERIKEGLGAEHGGGSIQMSLDDEGELSESEDDIEQNDEEKGCGCSFFPFFGARNPVLYPNPNSDSEQESEQEPKPGADQDRPFSLQTLSHFLEPAINWITAKENRPAAIAIGVVVGVVVVSAIVGITIATFGAGAVLGGIVAAGMAIKTGLVTGGVAAGAAMVAHPVCGGIAASSGITLAAASIAGAWFFKREREESTAKAGSGVSETTTPTPPM